MKTITVLYFARLKQEASLDSEIVQTEATSVAILYAECQKKRGLTLPFPQIRAAVNEAFCDEGTLLKNGDVVAFMPPMSGG